jgi:hypothetical protein
LTEGFGFTGSVKDGQKSASQGFSRTAIGELGQINSIQGAGSRSPRGDDYLLIVFAKSGGQQTYGRPFPVKVDYLVNLFHTCEVILRYLKARPILTETSLPFAVTRIIVGKDVGWVGNREVPIGSV